MVKRLTLLSLVLMVLGCGAAPNGVTFVLANVHPPGHPTAEALTELAERVAEDPRLQGRLSIDLQLAGVLGNEKETLEKLGFGGVQMVCSSTAPLAEFVPELTVLALPYLFRDSEHLRAAINGEVGRDLSAAIEARGFFPLAWYDAGARSFYNRERPVTELADLEGLRIRVQKADVMRRMVESLGALPVGVGFKQVYTSLHTGAIDGAENNLASFRSERHFEIAKHYVFDRHSVIPDVLLVSKAALDSLTPEVRAAFEEHAFASQISQREAWTVHAEKTIAFLEAEGVAFTELADPESFRAAVSPLYESLGERERSWVETIRALD